jgi:lipopolysaccharide/colanic/teichoic acid biosynthesis glycosyltransferase
MIAQELPSRTSGRDAVSGSSSPRESQRLKRACDLLAALALLVVAVPVIAAAWFVVRLTSCGPGFYSQARVGRNGRCFHIYKIRTMTHNCEAASGAKWSPKHDPRVTPVGRVLRKFHIDELPQLLNVLRGDMSLVGPRPERPEFVGLLIELVPDYAQRLSVRPGVTGLAQIQLPPDTDVDSVRRKLVFDRHYVRAGGIWLDFRIMLGTIVYLLGFSYPAVRKLVLLPNPQADALTDTVPDHPALGSSWVHRAVTRSERALDVETTPFPCAAAS